MQNPLVKYLKTAEGHIAVFYMEHNRVYCRRQSMAGWHPPLCVAEGVATFSLCAYEGYTYLLYPTTDGRLLLAASMDLEHWQNRPLWQEGGRRWQNTACFMIPQKDALHLIYAQKEPENAHAVLEYGVFQKGMWQSQYQISPFLPMLGSPFLGRRLGENHVILYYRTQRNTICAREILLSPFTLGSPVPLLQMNGQCIDISILEDAQTIHMLYIMRTLFRTQVVYRYKNSTNVSRPYVVWEGGNCEHCLLYQESNRLVLFWTAGMQPMRCTCEIAQNGLQGSLFGRIEKCTFPFPMQCVKGERISTTQQGYFATEQLGDRQNGYYPVLWEQQVDTEQAELQAASTDMCYTNPDVAEREKLEEIEELRSLLAQRSEEISAVNAKWKAQVEILEQQLQTLEQERKNNTNNINNININNTDNTKQIEDTSV